MAATVEFSESNGAIEIVTDGISNINFGSFDAANIVPASHPIIIGQHSYGKWLRVHLVALGGSTSISNFHFWKSSGAYVAGEVIGGNSFGNEATWWLSQYAHMIFGGGAIAVPVTGSGTIVTGSGDYNATPVPTATPAFANWAVQIGGGGTMAAPGYSLYNFIGMMTTGATPAGPVNQKVFTLQWDEV